MFVPQSFLCFLGEAQLKRPWSWQFCSKQSSDHQNPFINEGWYSLWILLLCFFTVVEIYLLLSYLGLCRDLSLSPSIAPWLFVSFGTLWFFCHTNKACVFCFASIFFVIIMQTQNWRRSKKKDNHDNNKKNKKITVKLTKCRVIFNCFKLTSSLARSEYQLPLLFTIPFVKFWF